MGMYKYYGIKEKKEKERKASLGKLSRLNSIRGKWRNRPIYAEATALGHTLENGFSSRGITEEPNGANLLERPVLLVGSPQVP